MDYLKIYNSLIESAIINPKPDTYKETHHIVPKCMGGENNKENLVKLTAKQHFIAHWLLYKIYKTSKLAHAWYSMCRIGKGQDQRRINSKYFSYAAKCRSKVLSEDMCGSNNRFYGKKHTEKTCLILAEKASKQWKGVPKTKEHSDKISEALRNKPKSKEHREKLKGRVMLQNKETLQIVSVNKELVDKEFPSELWVNPRKLSPEKKYPCVYCGIITTNSNLSRWHNEKCKRKYTNEN